MATTRHTRAFTLVELLVVVGIIAVMIALLVPAVTRARRSIQEHATRRVIKQLELGLASFKRDFGVYPPSDENPSPDYDNDGAACLVYYLLGPAGRGWGLDGGGLLPFSNRTPERSYGPYYEADTDAYGADGFYDTFSPPKPILYYRRDTDPDADDGGWGLGDCDGFDSQAHALTFFRVSEDDSGGSLYLDKPYVLISAGPDRRYGPWYEDSDGRMQPATGDESGGSSDDITSVD